MLEKNTAQKNLLFLNLAEKISSQNLQYYFFFYNWWKIS